MKRQARELAVDVVGGLCQRGGAVWFIRFDDFVDDVAARADDDDQHAAPLEHREVDVMEPDRRVRRSDGEADLLRRP